MVMKEKNEIISASRKEIEGELDYMILGQYFCNCNAIIMENDESSLKSDPLSAKYPLIMHIQ